MLSVCFSSTMDVIKERFCCDYKLKPHLEKGNNQNMPWIFFFLPKTPKAHIVFIRIVIFTLIFMIFIHLIGINYFIGLFYSINSHDFCNSSLFSLPVISKFEFSPIEHKNQGKRTKICISSYLQSFLKVILNFSTVIIRNLTEAKHLISIFKNESHLLRTLGIVPGPKIPINYRNSGCINEKIEQGRSYTNINISITDCFFSRSLSHTGNGGVIFIGVSSKSLVMSHSMCFNCTSAGYGGAIYFSSSDSFLRMICANRCSASLGGQFAWFQTSQFTQIEYLSVSFSSPISLVNNPLYISTSAQIVDNTNSSMNNAKQVSGIYINNPSSFTSSYCTFANNKVSESKCIYIFSSIGTSSMSYANIVHNNSPSIGVVYVQGDGLKKMMNCIFKNNHNYLFYVHSGFLEVSDSFIDHSLSFSTNVNVSTAKNNSWSISTTYQMQFFNSHHCNTDYSLIDLTPVETISITNEETFRMTIERSMTQIIETPKETPYRTYELIQCTHQLEERILIKMVFSFSFIC